MRMTTAKMQTREFADIALVAYFSYRGAQIVPRTDQSGRVSFLVGADNLDTMIAD